MVRRLVWLEWVGDEVRVIVRRCGWKGGLCWYYVKCYVKVFVFYFKVMEGY